MYICDVQLDGRIYKEVDEFTMTVGNTYLVHSDKTGYFLGMYYDVSRSLGSYAFQNCQFYKHDYYGNLILSEQKNSPVVIVSMVHIIVREC
jgi:hypothetical protein